MAPRLSPLHFPVNLRWAPNSLQFNLATPSTFAYELKLHSSQITNAFHNKRLENNYLRPTYFNPYKSPRPLHDFEVKVKLKN